MEEKNFIIFMVLTMLIIMAWFMLFGPKPKTPPLEPESALSGATAEKPAPAPGTTAAGSTASLPEVSSTPTAAGAEVQPGTTIAPLVPEINEQKLVLVTDVYEVEFTSRGAAPAHWKLLDYPVEKCFPIRVDVAWPPITRDPPCDVKPVDLVESAFNKDQLPLMSQITVDNHLVPYGHNWELETQGDVIMNPGDTVAVVSFGLTLPDSRRLQKVYRFRPSHYDVELVVKLEGAKPASAKTELALFYRHDPHRRMGGPTWNFNGPIVRGARTDHIKPETVLKKGSAEAQNLDWAGFTSDYFLTAILSENGSGLYFLVENMDGGKERKKSDPIDLKATVKVVAGPETLAKGELARLTLFIGPKDRRTLGLVRESLKESIDYGMLKILVMPLIEGLIIFNRAFHNYGLSIVVLTIIIRMLLFPLTRKSQKAMKQMQKLQPEILKLKEKHPDDKMKQQEEMQALWRRHKINPAMGCLPILLQFPVFFAFYKALLISIELRQAPFFGWIIDLSCRDPLYIWPVLMGATQLITQKMTPTQMDKTQQKIFLAMPIVFTYILRNFPAGLLIYWTVQNIVGIGQQIYVNRQPD